MKYKLKIWYETQHRFEDEIDVDVPEDESIDTWLDDNQERLLIENGCQEEQIEKQIEFNYAGTEVMEIH